MEKNSTKITPNEMVFQKKKRNKLFIFLFKPSFQKKVIKQIVNHWLLLWVLTFVFTDAFCSTYPESVPHSASHPWEGEVRWQGAIEWIECTGDQELRHPLADTVHMVLILKYYMSNVSERWPSTCDNVIN